MGYQKPEEAEGYLCPSVFWDGLSWEAAAGICTFADIKPCMPGRREQVRNNHF